MNSSFALPPRASIRAALIAGLFVVLWSSGFVGAKFGMPWVGPLTFLSLRYALVVLLILPVCVFTQAQWPLDLREFGHVALAGVLMQGGYLGGVFTAVHLGMPAGVIALVIGLQPILTALLSERMLAERVSARQWLGLALGLLGVAMVMIDKMQFARATLESLVAVVVALLSITLGTVYQKRYCGRVDFRTNSAIQFSAALLLTAPLAWWSESWVVHWSAQFVFALVWLVLVLSLGAVFLLFALLRRGAATSVTSLIYLCPPVTALMAWLLFDETYAWSAAFGMAVAMLGVAIVTTEQSRRTVTTA